MFGLNLLKSLFNRNKAEEEGEESIHPALSDPMKARAQVDVDERKLRSYMRGWLFRMFANDAAEKLDIGRSAAAVGNGLDPQNHVSRFAGYQQVENNNASGLLKGALLAAALTGFGGAGALLLPMLMKKLNPPAPVAAPATIDPEAIDLDIEVIDGQIIIKDVRAVEDDKKEK